MHIAPPLPIAHKIETGNKISNCVLKSTVKQTALQEGMVEELSFEWSHFRISSINSQVRTTLCSIIHSATVMYCSMPFI